MNRLLFILPFLLSSVILFSQDSPKLKRKKDDKVVLRYKHEVSGGFRFKTNGWAMFIEKAKIKSIYKRRLYQVEFNYSRHPKEFKQDANSTLYKDYKYGKWNNFFALQFNYGVKKSIAEKAKKAGVDVAVIYAGGVSMGFIKPYYLALKNPMFPEPGNEQYIIEKYSPVNADRFLSEDAKDIAGYAGIKYGFSDMQIIWGGHAKVGLNFDWAGSDDFVKALEVGAEVEVYYRNIPLMIIERNRPYLLNLYISIQFGKRY